MTRSAELAQADVREAPVIEGEGFLLPAPFYVNLCHFFFLFGSRLVEGGGIEVGCGGISDKRL